MRQASCNLLNSYIKPQLNTAKTIVGGVVIYWIPTSNHNIHHANGRRSVVVIYWIPTSNHNRGTALLNSYIVVIYWIPTSNHNSLNVILPWAKL